MRFAVLSCCRLAFVALCGIAVPGIAFAFLIDSVDVERRGREAEITIFLTRPVQYVRHAPQRSGKSLRVFVTETGQPQDLLDFETLRLPSTDMLPRFSVVYPEANNSLLVEFDRATEFRILASPDGRSLKLFVPVLPGAADWVVQARRPNTSQEARSPAMIGSNRREAISASSPAAEAEQTVTSPAIAPPMTPEAATASTERAIETAAAQTQQPAAAVTGRDQPLAPPMEAGTTISASDTDSTSKRESTASVPPTESTPADTAAPAMTSGSPPSQTDAVAMAEPVPTPPATAPPLSTVMAAEPVPALSASSTAVPAAPDASPSAAVSATPPTPVASTATMAQAPAVMPSTTREMPKLTPLTKEEIESRASEWIEAARQAIAARRGVIASQRLNQVLSLPTNSHTEEAQALMGQAREFSGELSKAKAEYETYLRLYPNGKFETEVKTKLAALGQSLSQTSRSIGLKPEKEAVPVSWTTFGSVSQYYYFGKSQIETITPPPPGQLVFNRDSLSFTDQRSLISNVDMQARRNDGVTDTRIVIRDTDNHNYLDDSRSYNRMYSGYVEQTNKSVGYFFRAGRQLGTGNGVLGRFDGLSVGYNLNPRWRVNAVGGTPVEFGSPFDRTMYGASMEYIPQLGEFGYSLYYNNQTVESVQDRQAVGTEIRYFDPYTTFFGMLDYDVKFHELNIAMLQFNRRNDAGTNYFANMDVRKSPPLSLITALPGQISLDPFVPTLDWRTLLIASLSNLGLAELRTQASLLTANSEFYSAGFTHPVTPQWQLGADYRQAKIGGLEASGILPAQPGSGTSHVLSGQALGNSVWLNSDAAVLNASYILAPNYTGQAVNVTYVLPYERWRLDSLLRLYLQKDEQGQKQTRYAPTLKLAYRWRDRVSIETEIGIEWFDDTGPIRELRTQRRYIFTGYRWDIN